jgi:hypothetical protein
MLGINRDEAGIYIPAASYPTPGTPFIAYLDGVVSAAFGAPPGVFSAALGIDKHTPADPFPGLPPVLFNTTHPATPAQVFDATVRLTSNWLFACNTFAKAHTAAKYHAFKDTYVFSFNRTYSPRGYTATHCDPPVTPSHPHGDPDGEYMKCHAGEQMSVFGTERRGGLPDRDGLDVPFMQLVVDYWAAFARWGDPNPRSGWLEARGYVGTLEEVGRAGTWDKTEVEEGGTPPTMRVLQWGGKQVELGEGHKEVCEGLRSPVGDLEERE